MKQLLIAFVPEGSWVLQRGHSKNNNNNSDSDSNSKQQLNLATLSQL